jgi:hypothetical protein
MAKAKVAKEEKSAKGEVALVSAPDHDDKIGKEVVFGDGVLSLKGRKGKITDSQAVHESILDSHGHIYEIQVYKVKPNDPDEERITIRVHDRPGNFTVLDQ